MDDEEKEEAAKSNANGDRNKRKIEKKIKTSIELVCKKKAKIFNWHMVILPSSMNIHFIRALAPIIRLQIWFIKKNYRHFVCLSVSHTHARTLTWKRTRTTSVECKAEHNWYRFMFTARESLEFSWFLLPYYLFTLNEFDVVYGHGAGNGQRRNG